MNAGYDLTATQQVHLEEEAASGDAGAAFALAEYHDMVTGNYLQQLWWLHRSADLGLRVAKYNLGYQLKAQGNLAAAEVLLQESLIDFDRAGDTYESDLARSLLEELCQARTTTSLPDTPTVDPTPRSPNPSLQLTPFGRS